MIDVDLIPLLEHSLITTMLLLSPYTFIIVANQAILQSQCKGFSPKVLKTHGKKMLVSYGY